MFNPLFLNTLGWKPYFQQQLSLDEFETCAINRVVAVHRDHIECLIESNKQDSTKGESSTGESCNVQIPKLSSTPMLATGDWIIVDSEQHILRRLERFSLIERKSPGTQVESQLMVANVDTLFIVSSLNQDFSLNRIERYLAISRETDIAPVVVLTKKDLCTNANEYLQQVQALDANLPVFAVNALESESLHCLQDYCLSGNTVCLLGSSGVGKSTLINGLMGEEQQSTGGIRHSDGKGKHTTTKRQLIPLEAGGVLIDTPGMRELQVINCKEGIQEIFADIEALASQCKFSNCQHQTEPGCAIHQAMEEGKLDSRRLNNYRKLLLEEAHNTASIAEKRAKDRQLSKLYKTGMQGRLLRREGMEKTR